MVDAIGIPMTPIIGASGLGNVKMFTAYVLESKKDDSYYIGSTDNFEKRLVRHNKGLSKYTKNKRPWVLIYRENYNTRSEAKKREYYLKSLKSRKAIEKLIKKKEDVVADSA